MATLLAASDETKPDRPPRARRWVPLSLRMLLTLLAILGMTCSWACVRGYRQLAVIREIEELGGSVVQFPAGQRWFRELIGEDRMRMFDNVTGVWLQNTQITDAGLAHLGGFTTLQILDLDNTHVTDAGLEHLRGLTNLRLLYLFNTRVTDAGLAHLRGLTVLQELSLYNTQVTDAGVAELRRVLPYLR